MVAQYVFNFPGGPAQQLFNDGAALQNETKRYASFLLLSCDCLTHEILFPACIVLFYSTMRPIFHFFAPGMRNALAGDRTAATLLWPHGNVSAMF